MVGGAGFTISPRRFRTALRGLVPRRSWMRFLPMFHVATDGF
jgi:hypothetical protein